jgi:hypothetical protein
VDLREEKKCILVFASRSLVSWVPLDDFKLVVVGAVFGMPLSSSGIEFAPSQLQMLYPSQLRGNLQLCFVVYLWSSDEFLFCHG